MIIQTRKNLFSMIDKKLIHHNLIHTLLTLISINSKHLIFHNFTIKTKKFYNLQNNHKDNSNYLNLNHLWAHSYKLSININVLI